MPSDEIRKSISLLTLLLGFNAHMTSECTVLVRRVFCAAARMACVMAV